jgi:hypothetical protein
MGLRLEKRAIAAKSVSAKRAGSSLASCTQVQKNLSGSLPKLCDSVTATPTVLSYFPASLCTCSA